MYSLFSNNTGIDNLVYNLRIGDKRKYIQVAFHFTCKLVENGTIIILWTISKENLADIYTKTIIGPDFSVLTYLIINWFYYLELIAVLFQLLHTYRIIDKKRCWKCTLCITLCTLSFVFWNIIIRFIIILDFIYSANSYL